MSIEYIVVSVISALRGQYARYKYYQKFYITKDREIFDFALYGIYYILNNVVYLVFNIPILNLLVNVFCLLFIAISYERNIKKAIFATLWTLGIIFAIELIVALLTGYILEPSQSVSGNNYHSLLGPILSNIIFYVTIVVIYKNKSISNVRDIPIGYWIAVLTVPFTTIYFMMTIVKYNTSQNFPIIVMSIMVLGINFSIFTLFDKLNDYYANKIESESIELTNQSYSEQIVLLMKIEKNMYSFQHDMNKHINSIRYLIDSNELSRIKDYLDEIHIAVNEKKLRSSSGNLIIDSILNYEFAEVEDKDIDLNIDINALPIGLEIKDYDLTIILNNLIHNAIEAVESIEINKFIEVVIKYNKGMLYIKHRNSYNGVLKEENGKIVSIKDTNKSHGNGLNNILRVVNKYEGEMTIASDNNIFEVCIMLYVIER